VSGKFKFDVVQQRKPAPRPPRRRERDAQPIPRAPDVFPWRANVEIVLGLPRADRKAKDPRNA
jgi:hypothetical protein